MKAFNENSNESRFLKTLRPYLADIIAIAVSIVAAAVATYIGATLIGDKVLDLKLFPDTWFDSDVAAYFAWLENRTHYLHVRTYKHPLFSLILCLPVYALNQLGLDLIVATRCYMALISGLWLGALYLLLRLLGCRRFDALLFGSLGATSAAAMFWFIVPESYPFGSLSFIVAAILTVLAQGRSLPFWAYVATNLFTLSITVTNWMAGILATILVHSKKQALRIFGWSLGILIGLAAIQKLIFPTAAFPPFIPKRGELSYLFSSESGGSFRIIQSLFAHTLVMPKIQIIPHPRTGDLMMVTQFSSPGSGSVWGAIAVGVWLALLALGIWAFFRLKIHIKFRIFLGLLLLAQLSLHLVYTGRETFLYSLHFVPFFIVLAALSTLTRARLWCLGLASVLLVCLVLNNSLQFNQARSFYHRQSSSHPTSERQEFQHLSLEPPYIRANSLGELEWVANREVQPS